MSESIIHPTADQLQSFVEGILADAEKAVLESHLLGCPACKGEVEEWRSLFSVLATLPQLAPSAGFANRVMAHVVLPDPWYVRAAARVGAQLQTIAPKTTRGWAYASAILGLPAIFFGALTVWLFSKPYITSEGLFAFTVDRGIEIFSSAKQGTITTLLHSDIALYAARGLDALTTAGPGAAGALALVIASATALSAWVLYKNLFRPSNTGDNQHYVSYSF
jgi:hypothetical protein